MAGVESGTSEGSFLILLAGIVGVNVLFVSFFVAETGVYTDDAGGGQVRGRGTRLI